MGGKRVQGNLKQPILDLDRTAARQDRRESAAREGAEAGCGGAEFSSSQHVSNQAFTTIHESVSCREPRGPALPLTRWPPSPSH